MRRIVHRQMNGHQKGKADAVQLTSSTDDARETVGEQNDAPKPATDTPKPLTVADKNGVLVERPAPVRYLLRKGGGA